MATQLITGRLHASLLAAVAVYALLGGCSRTAPNKSDAVRPVKTMVVVADAGVDVRVFPGRVDSGRKAELTFLVPGLIVELPVVEGQTVAAGDVIARLRQDEFNARKRVVEGQRDQAQSRLNALMAGERPEETLRLETELRSAELRLANAKAEYDRVAALVESSAVARAEYERVETVYRIAEEQAKAAKLMLEIASQARGEDISAQEGLVRALSSQIDELELQIKDSTLVAPFAGVIARRYVDNQQSIRALQPIVELHDTSETDVLIDVSEGVMLRDFRSKEIVEVSVQFGGQKTAQTEARIKEVSKVADPVTQTYQVRLGATVPQGAVALPGMSATVTITSRRPGEAAGRVMVPIAAVYKDAGGEQVTWIVGTDQSVSRRSVKLGEASGGMIEVVEGLQAGDRVAVAGVTFLNDGMKVRDLGDALGERR